MFIGITSLQRKDVPAIQISNSYINKLPFLFFAFKNNNNNQLKQLQNPPKIFLNE